MIFVGFNNTAVLVFAITGLLLLIEDVKAYQHAGLKKERKVAKYLGWLNLSLGFIIFLVNWILQEWYF